MNDQELRVVTWNILQPIFASNSLYHVGELLEPHKRQVVLDKRLKEMASDVVLLQELGRGQLDTLLEGALAGHMHHYSGVELAAQTFDGKTDDWGVAVVWRPEVLQEVEPIELGITGCYGPHPVACVCAYVKPWGESAIFVAVHLDSEGAPPSISRSQAQVHAICVAVRAAAAQRGVARIVWGGDFNQPITTNALRDATQVHGLQLISGEVTLPTCYTPISYSRIDHLFATGVECTRTVIPAYPGRSCCAPGGAGFPSTPRMHPVLPCSADRPVREL